MVSPAKIKAFVDQQQRDPSMAALQNPSLEDEPEDDGDGDADEPEPAQDPLTRGQSLIGQWGELGQALVESKGEIVDGAHDVGAELLLAKIPEDAIDEVHDNFDRMPDDIQQALAKYVAGLSQDDCMALATALIDGQDGDTEEPDQKLVCVYLQQLASYAKEEVDPADYADDDDDDEDEEDDDDGDGDAPEVAAADGVGNAGEA